MIQIYSPTNLKFDQNGDTVLEPVSCFAECELNKAWELELVHPIDDEDKWKQIVYNAVISVNTFVGKRQLYRIYKTEKNMDEVTAYARPIFMDSANEVWLFCNFVGKNGQQALNIMTNGTKYKGISDIGKGFNAEYNNENLISAINGDSDYAMLKMVDGEILYDNYTIKVMEHIGADNGVTIEYGKNITAIEEEINTDDICTRIYPVGHKDRMLSTANPYVDSEYINVYPKIYTKTYKFDLIKYKDDNGKEGKDTIAQTIEEFDNYLIQAARLQFSNGVDRPKVKLSISMVDLYDTEEYKDYSSLEYVSLGDTVYCKHHKLGISTTARVTKIKWNCVTDKVEEVEVGNHIQNFYEIIRSTVNRVDRAITQSGGVIAEQVTGTLNAMQTQLMAQRSVEVKNDCIAMLFEDTDPNSQTYGAMSYGTQGLQIAKKKTANGSGWDWTTAITALGIHAPTIVTGILSDQAGKNYWNLDTGAFRLSASTSFGGIPMTEFFREDPENLWRGTISLDPDWWEYNTSTALYGKPDCLGGNSAIGIKYYANSVFLKQGLSNAVMNSEGSYNVRFFIKHSESSNRSIRVRYNNGDDIIVKSYTVLPNTWLEVNLMIEPSEVVSTFELYNYGGTQGTYHICGLSCKKLSVSTESNDNLWKGTASLLKTYWTLTTDDYFYNESDGIITLTNYGDNQTYIRATAKGNNLGATTTGGYIVHCRVKAKKLPDAASNASFNFRVQIRGEGESAYTVAYSRAMSDDVWTTIDAPITFHKKPTGIQFYVQNCAEMKVTDIKLSSTGITQESIFNALTENGTLQGIYMEGGNLYVNGTYIKANSIAADKINVTDLYALNATIGGWKIDSSNIKATVDSIDNIILNKNGRITIANSGYIKIGTPKFLAEGKSLVLDGGITIKTKKDGTSSDVFGDGSEAFGDGTGLFKITGLQSGTGTNLVIDSSNAIRRSSSSKRYKDDIGLMHTRDAEALYDLPVVEFKYKEGILAEDDQFSGKSMFGFYAEDVNEIYPNGCVLNEEGTAEDWNHRTIIPAMLKLIQDQNERIKKLEGLLNPERENDGN